MLNNPTALLILVCEAEGPAPADPAKPPNDTGLETVPIIQAPFDPCLLIRAWGIN